MGGGGCQGVVASMHAAATCSSQRQLNISISLVQSQGSTRGNQSGVPMLQRLRVYLHRQGGHQGRLGQSKLHEAAACTPPFRQRALHSHVVARLVRHEERQLALALPQLQAGRQGGRGAGRQASNGVGRPCLRWDAHTVASHDAPAAAQRSCSSPRISSCSKRTATCT